MAINIDLLSKAGLDYLQKHYVDEMKSPRTIASEIGTYHNKVVRALEFHRFEIRNKSNAQKAALSAGKAQHPTKGRRRTQEERDRISLGRKEAWDNMSDAERAAFSAQAKAQWDNLPETEKQEYRIAATKALSVAAKKGSALERYLVTELLIADHEVRHHAEWAVRDEHMHVDILLPVLKVAIEVDGAAHYLPIWGEEQLEKSREADSKKNGLLLRAGFHVVRIKHVAKNLMRHHKRTAVKELLAHLESLPTQPQIVTLSTEKE